MEPTTIQEEEAVVVVPEKPVPWAIAPNLRTPTKKDLFVIC
eukprot:CAMPEP_0172771824 /NCGR_PEP_ID=MMETSP1074-20121228/191235_1 /TAXON_ID=2916 /ORGANISM="Ceratium fusus, Strain PA161109" /LENGTH=40 /DNA_ID= /DNA_START= /DNA_END= /DNA_ORIENTATION=